MRYLPLTADDRRQMLAAIGVGSVDDLFCDVPKAGRLKSPIDLPNHAGEIEVETALSTMAAKNLPAGSAPSFLGGGIYRHFVPAAVDHLIQRGEFLTAYTPYQPEVSQGTLQYLFEFQTQVALLTGCDVANASMYDGATACAEAVIMAGRITKRKKAVMSGGLHPHYAGVTATSAEFLGIELVSADPDLAGEEDLSAMIDGDTACVVVQNPDFFGRVRDLSVLAEACHAQGALLVVVVTEIVSTGLIKSPGDMGADIVAGEGQSLGNALNFGGPTVGLMATRQKFVRQLPGRLVGQTTDVDGQRGFVLTLSTREQHIRRDKATSNICTNSGLCALAFTIHLTMLGEVGLRKMAELNHANAVRLADRLAEVAGVEVLNDTFFNEFTVRLSKPASGVVDTLAEKGVFAGVPVSRLLPGRKDAEVLLLMAVTELNSDNDMDRLIGELGEALR
ncbi:MAG: aminomethyl-transferring glycine dehydrogenase subunit GcvPA [Rhodospirillales bacterium]|jgi:glycine dehydrogenase subunit 1|nr:aminomethyl-transferring glycine dehydrogenase subunit GcvPA [Rhodospirillales bacterium]